MLHTHKKSKSLKLRHLVGIAAATHCLSVFAAPPPPPVYAPEILVTGMNTAIYAGSDQPLKMSGTYFNKAEIGVNTWEHTFEIRNFGNDDLILTTPLTLTGPHAADFAVTQQPVDLVPAGQRTSFKVAFTPSFAGEAYCTVNIENNDSDETTYTFSLRGDGVTEPLQGPDLSGELTFYKKYKCKGIPLLACKMSARVEVTNLAENFDQEFATVRIYVVNGDVLSPEPYLLDEKVVKNLKSAVPGKKLKTKRVKLKGLVPPGYTHIYAEVVPEGLPEGMEDIDYTNNRTEHVYGI